MIPAVLAQDVVQFLAQVQGMTIADMELVHVASRKAYPARRAARGILSLSAADHSHLEKQVLDVARPLLRVLEWPSTELEGVLTVEAMFAAQAIIRRDRLSPEQYEAFVGGFRLAGLDIPPHPSQVSEES